MKLSTYNFLTSQAIRGVKVGFPLKLTVTKQVVTEVEYNAIFLIRLIPKLDWDVVRIAAGIAGSADDIPKDLPIPYHENEELLRKLHHILLEVDVIEGELECPESGRKFPITDGIANMLLNEDEV